MGKYWKKTRAVSCSPGDDATALAKWQWGDEARLAISRKDEEALEDAGFWPAGSVSVRSSQRDFVVYVPWGPDDMCPECGGHVLWADTTGETSHCDRCGQEWDSEGLAQHGPSACVHFMDRK